jgi:hypothetical protein
MAYPVDTPGYIYFPGVPGNYMSVPDNPSIDIIGNITITAFIAPDSWTPAAIQTIVSKWNTASNQRSYRLDLNPAGTLGYAWSTTGSDSPGVTSSVSVQSVLAAGQTLKWVSVTHDVGTDIARFWISDDGVAWTKLGADVPATATTAIFASSANLTISGINDGSSQPFAGKIGFVSLRDNVGTSGTVGGGTQVFCFDANLHLAGVVPDAETFACTPATSVATIVRKKKAIGQGYARFPGTIGNYLETPDAAALDVTTAMYIILRMRQVDSIPNYFASPVGKGLVYRLASGPYGSLYTWGPNDTSSFRSASNILRDDNGKWVWYSFYYNPAGGANSNKGWYSLEDSITPPAAASWTLSYNTGPAASPVGNSDNPLLIGAGWLFGTVTAGPGPSIRGDIGYVSIRTGTGATPVEGTEVFTLNADSFVDVTSTDVTLKAATGQDLTVQRNPAPVDNGYVQFPGTAGNDLMVADTGTVYDIVGPSSIVISMSPVTWRPFEEQTIISKWGVTNQRSYAVALDTSGYLMFLWSTNGTAYTTLKSSVPVLADSGQLWVKINTVVAATRTVDFFTSLDGVDWTALGTQQSGAVGIVYNSTSPLLIGPKYDGKISEVSIYGSTTSTSIEMFRIAPEHIPANPNAPTIVTPTGTLTVRRDAIPIDYGYVNLPGTVGNYLSVPNAANLQNITGFVVEARLVIADWTPTDVDREIMSKTNAAVGAASNLGWKFLLTATGKLAFQWSTNGTTYANYIESGVLGFAPNSAKRVAVSYEASQYVRFWVSDDNKTWTRISQTPVSGALFASTAPLLVGQLFKGMISHFSYRGGFDPGGVPIQGNEVLLVDQRSLDIAPAATSFTAVTSQVVTIVRNTTAANTLSNTGYIYFPGTSGNYTTTTAAGPPAFPAVDGSISFTMRIAPDRWRGRAVIEDDPLLPINYVGPVQTICGRWSAGNNHAYLLRLSPEAEFIFTWTSSDGVIEYSALSVPVPLPADGEFRTLRLTVEMVSTTQTLHLEESADAGDTWTSVGSRVTTYNTTGLVQGTGPFWIGAQELAGGGADHFAGRISHLVIRGNSNAEIFRLDQEALRVSTTASSFVEGRGKTVTLLKSATPTISGYASFGGVSGEYCRAVVPNLSPVTSSFSLVTRVKFTTPVSEDDDQILVQKWNPVGPSVVTNKALLSNVATIITSTPHGLKVGEQVVVSDVGAPFDGTYTVTVVPSAQSFSYAKTNANITSIEATGNVTPLGRSFSLSRSGTDFIFRASQDGATDVISAAITDLWDDEAADWGWLAVTVKYDLTLSSAVVTFWTAPDVLVPAGFPLIPLPTEWVLQGDPLIFDDVTSLYMDTEMVTFGGSEAGSPMSGQISNVSITDGIGTDNRPGGTERFGWNINSFAGIAPDSAAFTAKTGENVVLEPLTGRTKIAVVPSAPGPTTDITPSTPGSTTEILPSPIGPSTTLVRGEDGPTTTLVASDVGPFLKLMSPSLNRPWWPGTEQDDTSRWWIQPAFTVHRNIDTQVGDYVRGSTSTRTQQTAIRYPTSLPGWTPAGVGRGILYSSPINYDTIEIEWNIPPQLTISVDTEHDAGDILWSEVLIVRCGMGYPATVNDGQAVMRMTKQQLYPNGYRYDSSSKEIVTPNQFDPRALPSQDPGLTPGRWYYYGLFFKIGRDWVRSAVHCCLLPRNFHHADHLWNGLPPYYRHLDDNMRGGANDGDLKRWLGIFGYHLDYTREYVESMSNMYHTDFTPMSLLRRIGDNFGVPFEPAIGDYCYRALVGKIGHLYRGRGTVGGLMSLVATVAKCDSDVTQSDNVMLLPDNSEFVNGTGDWAGIHEFTYGPGPAYPPPTGTGVPAGWLSPLSIFFSSGTYGFTPAPVDGKGMMHVYTAPGDSTANIFITCGDGRLPPVPPETQSIEILPRDRSTPVKPGDIYAFSISVATEFAGPTFQAILLWFDADGMPADYLSHSPGASARTPTINQWLVTSVSGAAPLNAAYVVPAIAITGRVAGTNTSRSPMVHFSGASLSYVGSSQTFSSDIFVKTLTLTGPTGLPVAGGEEIGPGDGGHPDPYFIGEPSS